MAVIRFRTHVSGASYEPQPWDIESAAVVAFGASDGFAVLQSARRTFARTSDGAQKLRRATLETAAQEIQHALEGLNANYRVHVEPLDVSQDGDPLGIHVSIYSRPSGLTGWKAFIAKAVLVFSGVIALNDVGEAKQI